MSAFIIWTGFALLAIMALVLMRRQFGRSLLFTAVTGNLALLGVGWAGAFTGVVLSFNLATSAAATLLGVPGVIGLLVIRMLFHVG